MKQHILLITIALLGLSACRPSLEEQIDALCAPLFPAGEPGAAVAIIQGDEVTCRTYGLATMDPDVAITDSTLFNIASCSKQFTAVNVLQLVELGLIDLEAPVAAYMPGLTDPIWQQIKVKHLMAHSSGVPDERGRIYTREERLKGDDAMALYYLTRVDHLNFEPGTAYEYINPTFVLLGAITESVTGTPFCTSVWRHIFVPCGMDQTIYFDPEERIDNMAHGYEYEDVSDMPEERIAGENTGKEKNWYEYDYGEETFFATRPDGGIYSSLRDLIKWEMALRKIERGETRGILSRGLLREAMSPHTLVSGSPWSDYQNRDNTYYGYGWFIEPKDPIKTETLARPCIYHTGDNGGFKILIARYPEQDAAIIILSNRADWDRYELKSRLETLIRSKQKQKSDEERIREMVERLHTTYPAATLQDVYKTCYQDYWGAEHIAPDSMVAARYLEYELSTMEGDTMRMPKVEPCGWRHRYERLSLQAITDGEMTKEEVLSRFLHAAEDTPARDGKWAEEWEKVDSIACAIVPEWQDGMLRADLKEAAELDAAVHHSDAFREAYKPHYRIINNEHI